MELNSKYSVFSNLATGLFQNKKYSQEKAVGGIGWFVSEHSLKKICLFRVKI